MSGRKSIHPLTEASINAQRRGNDALDEHIAVIARATGKMCARCPADADDIRQEALLAVLDTPNVPAPVIARNAAVDYLRKIYGKPGSRRIQSAHVVDPPLDQVDPMDSDTVDLLDPVTTWGLSGRLAIVAECLIAGLPKWQIADMLGISASRVSHHCEDLRAIYNDLRD